MKSSLLIVVILLTTLTRAPHAQQPPASPGGHYAKDGVAFDYPAGWAVNDTGIADLQRILLTHGSATNIIMLFAQRQLIKTAAQLSDAHTSVTLPYVENIAHKLGLNNAPPPEEAQCVAVGDRYAVGFRLNGQVGGEPTRAEVYTIVLGERLLHLVNFRAEKDEAAGAVAWKTLLDTLKVEPPAQPSPEAGKVERLVAGGVINGKAVKKPAPEYPAIAKGARASGTVTVSIIVDEQGNVESATAISGHQLLHAPSVEAARKAKFTPTTACGRPVKVTGVITYNYVLR